MSFSRESLWDEALAALERTERLHRRMFALFPFFSRQPVWEPPVDMFENERAVWILVLLPGVRADNLSVSVEGSELVVRAERSPPPATEWHCVRRLEIPYGLFERRIELPQGSYTVAERRLADGCLELHLVRD